MLDKEFYIKNGLIYGVISIVYLMITYIMGIDAMISYWNMGISLVVGLGLMVYMGLQSREQAGGFATLGENFKNILIIMGLGYFLYLLFNFALNTIIDPQLPVKMFDATIENTMAMMEKFNVPEEELDAAYDQLEIAKEEIHSTYTIFGFLKSYLIMIGFGSVGAVIAAAITKKENPNPFQDTNA